MHRSTAKRITIDPLGPPTPGIWCPTCALPSGISIPVVLTADRATLTIGTYTGCLDCGQPIPVT